MYPITRFKNVCLLFCIFGLLSTSCNRDDRLSPDLDKDRIEKGRFDNTPFVWDVIYAPERIDDQIYIGDMSVQVVDNAPTKKMMVLNPIEVYLGAVFPMSSYLGHFDREIVSPKNPIDVVFDFKDPFIDYISQETGSVGYKLAMKKALNSSEYRTHLAVDRESLEYYFTEISSYRDIEKAFIGSTGLGSIFSAKVESKSKDARKHGRILARLVSRNFSVYMDTPVSGVFKDTSLNKYTEGQGEQSVYTKSLTYGRTAYVAIESEYSYSELKLALETGIKYKFDDTSMKMNKKMTDVFSKSTITIFYVSENTPTSYFADTLSNLNSLFTVNYTNLAYGYPIYLQGRYVHDNSAYIISEDGSSDERRNDGV